MDEEAVLGDHEQRMEAKSESLLEGITRYGIWGYAQRTIHSHPAWNTPSQIQ